MLEGSGAVMHCTTFLFMLMMSCAPAAVAASLAAAKVPDAQCVLLEPLSLQEHVSPLAMIMCETKEATPYLPLDESGTSSSTI